MKNLKILTEQQFLEQLDFKSNIPSDVKASVIYYVQHKNFSFNPYLYSAILQTLDSIPDKKFIKPAEVFKTAHEISKKYTVIQQNKYEQSDTEKTPIQPKEELPKIDSSKEEEIPNILSFASNLNNAYKKLTDEQKNTVDTGSDNFIFTEEGLKPINELRQILKDKNPTDKDLLGFLQSHEKDDLFFHLLKKIYDKNNGDKKVFENNFNKIIQILVSLKLSRKDISSDMICDILREKKEEFNLEETDFDFDNNSQQIILFKNNENLKEDQQILFKTLEAAPQILSILSQFTEFHQQEQISEERTPFEEAPISDDELRFNQTAEPLLFDSQEVSVDLPPDLFADFDFGEFDKNVNLSGIEEPSEIPQAFSIPLEETAEIKFPNETSTVQPSSEPKIKYSLKDRIIGLLNTFIKKQNKLPVASIEKTAVAHVDTDSYSNTENTGAFGFLKNGLKSLKTLFKHNKQTDSMTPSYVPSEETNIFTAGITADTLAQIAEVEKKHEVQTHLQSTHSRDDATAKNFEEH